MNGIQNLSNPDIPVERRRELIATLLESTSADWHAVLADPDAVLDWATPEQASHIVDALSVAGDSVSRDRVGVFVAKYVRRFQRGEFAAGRLRLEWARTTQHIVWFIGARQGEELRLLHAVILPTTSNVMTLFTNIAKSITEAAARTGDIGPRDADIMALAQNICAQTRLRDVLNSPHTERAERAAFIQSLLTEQNEQDWRELYLARPDIVLTQWATPDQAAQIMDTLAFLFFHNHEIIAQAERNLLQWWVVTYLKNASFHPRICGDAELGFEAVWTFTGNTMFYYALSVFHRKTARAVWGILGLNAPVQQAADSIARRYIAALSPLGQDATELLSGVDAISNEAIQDFCAQHALRSLFRGKV